MEATKKSDFGLGTWVWFDGFPMLMKVFPLVTIDSFFGGVVRSSLTQHHPRLAFDRHHQRRDIKKIKYIDRYKASWKVIRH